MANRRSSIKKIRVDKRRREKNVLIKSELKTVARKLRVVLAAKKKQDVAEAARSLFSKLDKAVKKKVIHGNRASRLKSRLQRRINALTTSK